MDSVQAPAGASALVVGGGGIDSASVRGGHRRSLPPSAGHQLGFAYRIAVTCNISCMINTAESDENTPTGCCTAPSATRLEELQIALKRGSSKVQRGV